MLHTIGFWVAGSGFGLMILAGALLIGSGFSSNPKKYIGVSQKLVATGAILVLAGFILTHV